MADTIVTVNIYAKTANTDNGWVPAPVAKQSPVLNYDADLDTTLSLLNFPNVFIYDAGTGQVINKSNLQTYYPEYNPGGGGGGGGGGGTTNYSDLTNKPKINNVTLQGNKSLSDIGAPSADEVYKKSEVDTALDNKVTKETGKGLSTNDFTNDALTKLSGIEPDAEANVQSDWNQTDTDSDDFIKNKPILGTAASLDMDTALDSASTNPVQNKAVQAPIARLIDAGSKNIADMSKTSFTSLTKGGVTVTLSGDTITSSGTSTSDTNNFFNVFYVDLSTVLIPSGKWVAVLEGTGIENFRVEEFDSYNGTALKGEFGKPFHFEIHTGVTVSYLRITTKPNTLCDGNFKLMICKEEDHKISPEFVPYAPSNRELYKMIGDINTVLEEVL